MSSIYEQPWLALLAIPISIYVAYKIVNRLIPGAHNLPSFNFENKIVVITGASSGLGKAIAYELHKRHAKLILLARSTEKLKEICDELKAKNPMNPNEPLYFNFDITEPQNGPWNTIPKIDVLINNAGISMRGSIADTPIEIQRKIMETNFFGHVEVIRSLLPKIDPLGCIAATSSVQGKLALPYRSAYSASKHALQAFCDSLRCEYKNLHVLVISAGYINTGFGAKAFDANGKAVGVEDEHQAKGYTPEYCATAVANAIRDRKTDFLMAGKESHFALFLRYAWPTLCTYALYRRGTKDPWAHQKKN